MIDGTWRDINVLADKISLSENDQTQGYPHLYQERDLKLLASWLGPGYKHLAAVKRKFNG
jgi:hypothetical protein